MWNYLVDKFTKASVVEKIAMALVVPFLIYLLWFKFADILREFMELNSWNKATDKSKKLDESVQKDTVIVNDGETLIKALEAAKVQAIKDQETAISVDFHNNRKEDKRE